MLLADVDLTNFLSGQVKPVEHLLLFPGSSVNIVCPLRCECLIWDSLSLFPVSWNVRKPAEDVITEESTDQLNESPSIKKEIEKSVALRFVSRFIG